MKNTGITRKVDDMGRIVLPMELRRNMGIEDGTPLEISVDGGKIVLSPAARALTPEELDERTGKPVVCKEKRNGLWLWIVILVVYAYELCGTNGESYAFCDFDFYDREV